MLIKMHAQWWNSPAFSSGGDLADVRMNDGFPEDETPPGPYVRHHVEPENRAAAIEETLSHYRKLIMIPLFYWLIDPPSMQVEENARAVVPRLALAALDLGTLDLLVRR